MNIAYENSRYIDENGNAHKQTGNFTWADGTTGSMSDVWFQTDNKHSVEKNLVEVSDEIAELPNIMENGIVHSLHQAMARDASGKLQALITQFVNEINSEAREALLDDIIFAWTGADQYASNSRGTWIEDGRILYALEAFLAKDFLNIKWGIDDPCGVTAINSLMNGYEILKQYVNGSLMLQTHLRPYISLVYFGVDSINVADAIDAIHTVYEQDAQAGLQLLKDFGTSIKYGFPSKDTSSVLLTAMMSFEGNFQGNSFGMLLQHLDKDGALIIGTDADEILIGGTTDNVIYGGAGNDVITDAGGNNYIDGGAGNDTITGAGTILGGAGNDTITTQGYNNYVDGGEGDDYIKATGTIIGGKGNDTPSRLGEIDLRIPLSSIWVMDRTAFMSMTTMPILEIMLIEINWHLVKASAKRCCL